MKKLICMLLVCVLCAGVFTGCDRRTTGTEEKAPEQSTVNFAEESNAPADEEAQSAEAQPAEDEEQSVVMDAPVDTAATLEPAPAATDAPAQAAVQPFATSTPQPNATVSGYSQVTNTGLGFKFSYPNGWNNIPGRSTVCYVQPMEDGTVYPARVAVTMKKLPHKCNDETAQTEFVEYLKVLMSQYDESTFEVEKELDTSTKFMGNRAMSTTYLAYDGDQEIQGYVIITYFERYLFCYHFLCAYEDYEAFGTAMRHMRDSVQPEQSAEAGS